MPQRLIAQWQFRAIKRIAAIAYNHVPIYKKIWNAHRITHRDIKRIEDVYRLPIINKRIFLSSVFTDTIHDSYSVLSAETYYAGKTSGSTGEPFKFLKLRDDQRRFKFKLYRFFDWNGCGARFIVDRLRVAHVAFDAYPFEKNYLFVPASDILRAISKKDAIDKILDFGADAVEGTVITLVELARAVGALPLKNRPSIKYAISYGEILSRSQREFIEQALNCEVYDRYGMEEIGVIGTECIKHDGFHLHDESVFVEIVDNGGNAVGPGTSGRIIVTQFYNYIMPFIRYETGDRGMIFPDACSCGISSRRLRIEGRSAEDIMINNKKFSGIEFTNFLGGFSRKILRFQLAKVSVNELEIRIIPSEDFSFRDKNDLVDAFENRFGFVPVVKIVAGIPPTARGKTPLFIDELSWQ